MGKRRLTNAVLIALVAAIAIRPGSPGVATGHRESRAQASNPALDAADFYVFRSPDDPSSVTLIATSWALQAPGGGPTFYPFANNARYEINIDNDGDARRDIAYRWVFRSSYRDATGVLYATGEVTSPTDNDLNFVQTYDLLRVQGGRTTRLLSDVPVAPPDLGPSVMPDYRSLRERAVHGISGGRAWAGPADDPYFADLRLHHLLFGDGMRERGTDSLAGNNVNVLAVQIKADRIAGPGQTIGAWSTIARKTGKRWSQKARSGMPLLGQLVIPFRGRDRYNSSTPVYDARLVSYVDDPEVVHDFARLHGTSVPDTNATSPGVQRDDLIGVYFRGFPLLSEPPGVRPSEQLRINLQTPVCRPGSCPTYSRLGPLGGDDSGFPNGRRLEDDVLDVTLQLLLGELAGSPNDTGDGVDGNDVAFTASFPYVPLPHRL